MARNKREMPTFFSFEIGPLRGLAESMTDEEWGKWSKNALNDLSIGCVKKDTDPHVKKMFDSAKTKMENEYQRKRKWYEENKAGNTAEKPESQATEDVSTHQSELGRRPERHQAQPVYVPQPVPPKILNLAYSGEFGNVRLTQEQYGELGLKFGNQLALNRAIDSLSSKLENGEIQPVPKNHYAVLVKWAAYRDDKREEKDEDAERNRYETVSEHNARVLKKSTEFIMNGGLEKLKNGTIETF